MTPYERMAARYRAQPTERSFEWYVSYYAKHGVMCSTPEYIVLARAVSTKAGEYAICSSLVSFPEADCDCWYIHAMAGDMSKAWAIMPKAYPWFAFERYHKGVRMFSIWKTSRIRSAIG